MNRQEGHPIHLEWMAVIAGLLISVVCAKPLLRPGNRLWPPAVLVGGCASGHNLKQRFFPTCYGSSYISHNLAAWLHHLGMDHVRGAPNHPQTQGKIER